MIKHW